ncbi:MAG: alpha/beta fold hydrolase [Sphingobacteriia bacterium]|nr:alpha/beta fold hydrolase [Sphingobacteriia bacterium]
MKKQFKQRVLIGYYKTKLKTIGLVAPQKAAELAFDLFSTPLKSGSKKTVPAVFHRGNRVSVEINGITVRGFEWKNSDPEARKILIVHGFSSYAYKFDSYVLALKKEGFTVLAFDAPGHGLSDGRKINALIYRDTILAIEQAFGPLYGVVAHSLGGLAAALAFEQLPDTAKRKLVLIAPATETRTAIDNFFKLIPATPRVVSAFEAHIEQLANRPITYFSVARVARQSLASTLWVHDEEDNICTFDDVKPLLSEKISSLEFFITKGLGHNRIYKEQQTRDTIIHFLAGRPSGDFL